MDIDLSALRLVEREKEIPFDTLVELIERALLNAYLKTCLLYTSPSPRDRG